MGDVVYIRDKNVIGEVVKEMAYGAIIKYIMGGIEFEELMDKDDYEDLEEMFFHRGDMI
jgi:hypothetical protein